MASVISIEYFRAKKSALDGDARAQFLLGSMYMRGNHIEKNYEEAIKWLTKAAEQGNVNAKIQLGSIYVFGKGVEASIDKALP
ncbi:MAG TPA: tetratricopeptide repeat protein [Smithellaceae bacterium]|jgi:hypothetical protein|nr:sel1 repeat family protein [Syntrophaceae bacterium]HNZ31082.1 tetratricopeptide repeat protein [Smithellaceae bacterium]MBP8609230.1 sel1 repeat family protein [Syntrophaceae bacterium]HOF78530.1 tetratricopeptide repeat protein [Smithellaceae bacterium]HOM69540.1 tetratricopeptide repeat protein [Smithellaceae bacterium]